MAAAGQPITVSLFYRLEFENAVRQKLFRREFDERIVSCILADVSSDLQQSVLILAPVIWAEALDRAREIGNRTTAGTGCRSLDLIHVAIAEQWACSVFVSADARQLAAAAQIGLRTVDVRSLPA